MPLEWKLPHWRGYNRNSLKHQRKHWTTTLPSVSWLSSCPNSLVTKLSSVSRLLLLKASQCPHENSPDKSLPRPRLCCLWSLIFSTAWSLMHTCKSACSWFGHLPTLYMEEAVLHSNILFDFCREFTFIMTGKFWTLILFWMMKREINHPRIKIFLF